MVVPLSLDPGRNDPRSPMFEGCHSCGTPGAPDPCRRCREEQRRAELEAERYREMKRKYDVRQGFALLFDDGDDR